MASMTSQPGRPLADRDAVNECTDAIDRLHDHVITVTELNQRSRPPAAQQSRPVIR